MRLVQVQLAERGAHLHDGERVHVRLQELVRQVLLQRVALLARARRVDAQRCLERRRVLQRRLEHATATVPDTPVSTRVYDSHRRRSVPHRAPSDDAVPALLHGERAAEGAQEDVRLHRRRLLAQYRQLALGELVDARHRAERVCALPPPRAGQCDAARDMRDERRVGYLPGEEREREASLNGF